MADRSTHANTEREGESDPHPEAPPPSTTTRTRILLRDESSSFPPVIRPVGSDHEVSWPDPRRYVVQGEIARGGIGIVVKGHDRDLGRDVALKLLRKKHRRDPELLQRFVEEAQIGGQLQHPGIAPVYELGAEGGTPFFSMKLIQGHTLAALLGERSDPEVDRARFLEIFEKACQTVGYAHSRGVVHRDLKPANIMVGGFGEVQVVDWGLSKVLTYGGTSDEQKLDEQRRELAAVATVRSRPSGSNSTAGSILGTPSYMPPEQAMGDVEATDKRSDVFALGALLCEILTGLPPYAGEGDEVLELAKSCATEGARERLAACRADAELVTLCEECLSSPRRARPSDAGVVARRISQYLHSVESRARDAQIQAAEERVRAEAARRSQKQTLALAASILVTVVLGAFGYWSIERSRQERMARTGASVEAALLEAGEARGRGDWQSEEKAVQRADSLVAVSDVSPALRDRVRTALRSTEAAARERAFLHRLAEIGVSAVGIDESSTRSSDALARRCEDYRRAFADCEVDVHEPKEAAVARLQAFSDPARIAAALDDWADATALLHRARGRAGQSEAVHAILDLAIRVDDDRSRRRLRRYWKEHAGAIADRRELETVLEDLALPGQPPMTAITASLLLLQAGAAERAMELLLRMTRLHPKDPVLVLRTGWLCLHPHIADEAEAIRHLSVAVALADDRAYPQQLLGTALFRAKRYREAEFHSRKALELGGRTPERLVQLGITLGFLREFEESKRLLCAAIATDSTSAEAHLALGTVHALSLAPREALESLERAVALAPRSARARAQLAWQQSRIGEHEKSLASYRRAAVLDPSRCVYQMGIADQLGALGRHDEQIAQCRRVLEREKACFAAHFVLAQCARRRGKLEDALAHARRALESDPSRAHGHTMLGALHTDRGAHAEALRHLEQALSLAPGDAWTLNTLGTVRLKERRLEDASECFTRVLRGATDPEPGDHGALLSSGLPAPAPRAHQLSMAHLGMGRVLFLQEKFGAARSQLEQAVRLYERNLEAQRLLASTYQRQQEKTKALEALRRVAALAPRNAQAQFELAVALSTREREDEAIARFEQVLEIDPRHALSWVGIGTIRARQRRYEDAAQAYRRAIEIAPDSLHGRVFLAEVRFHQGELEHARKLLESTLRSSLAAVRSSPEVKRVFVQTCNRVAIAHNHERAWRAAERVLRGAVEVDPHYGPAHVNLAISLRGQRRLDAALVSDRNAHASFARGTGDFAERWRDESARRVRLGERRIEAAESVLSSLRSGGETDAPERNCWDAAALAKERGEYALAVATFRHAFAAYAGLSRKPPSQLEAAGAAAGAIAGEELDQAEKAKVRARALSWLRGHLELGREFGSRERVLALSLLRRTFTEPLIERLRDPAIVATWPEPERESWRQLWSDAKRWIAELEEPR